MIKKALCYTGISKSGTQRSVISCDINTYQCRSFSFFPITWCYCPKICRSIMSKRDTLYGFKNNS